MAIDTASYLEELALQRGKLARWEAEIFQLYHARVSYQRIADFLGLNGTLASKMEVYRFIHRKKRRHLLNFNAPAPSPGENGGTARPLADANAATAGAGRPEQRRAEGAALPKFSWRQSRDKDKSKW